MSGGSITAGVLASRWSDLDFVDGVARNFVNAVVDPVRTMASTDVDFGAVFWGSVLPGTGFAELGWRRHTARHLFGDTTLQDLPDERNGGPRFVFNATNLESGVLFRFSKPYHGRLPRRTHPETRRSSIAVAVAASSAFPPVPLTVRTSTFAGADVEGTDDDGNDLADEPGLPRQDQAHRRWRLRQPRSRDGVEAVQRRCLVSDAGGHDR